MSQSNVTGQINVSDADAVAAEICNIIGARHANFDEQPIRQGFADMQDTCTGLYSGSTRALPGLYSGSTRALPGLALHMTCRTTT